MTARSGLVFDEDLLAPNFRESIGNDAGADIRTAAGRESNQQPHRTRRIGLRPCNARQRRQHRSACSNLQKLSSRDPHDETLGAGHIGTGAKLSLGALNVLISGGFAGAYSELLPDFERTSRIKVTTGSGSSQGRGSKTIAARLAGGAPADVVILSREGLSELIAANKILAGTDVDLSRVPLGVAVRAGTPQPDVSSVGTFKQAILGAGTIAVPESTSGIWLMTDLFPRLGLPARIDVKSTPRAADATAMVAAGGADLAVMPVSEIFQRQAWISRAAFRRRFSSFVQVFSAAVVAGSQEIAACKRLIEFFASARASEAIRKS